MSRYLGQHFLINELAIQKIIATLKLEKGDMVVEIGPGRGALTIPLSEKCKELGCKVVAIEKDQHLVNWLISKLVNWKNVRILEGDALKDLKKLINQLTNQPINYKIVGNIPYYITGNLLRVLSELENKPRLTVLTIQKEVAERVTAEAPRMNLLAAAVQIWGKTEIVGQLKPKDFSPPPKVDSAIIKIELQERLIKSRILEKYYKLIKIIFKQPRKTILNNLSTGLKLSKGKTLEMLKKTGLKGDERPQNLSLELILKLLTIL